MLDLTIFRRKLTQGQPQARMTLAIQRAEPTPSAPTQQLTPPPAEPAPSGAAINPYDLARRVYDLMRQELTVERNRRGSRMM